MNSAAVGRTMPRLPSDLAPAERALFVFAFSEELEAAGPEAPVTEPFTRAMARVRRFLQASP